MSDSKVRVLVVDDSALMRSLIKRIILSHSELDVAGIAMNGRFAQQKLPILDPDVMVLDLEMPEVNGIEFLRWREKEGIQVPVIILSALATQGAKVTMEALSLGAADFITKPTGSGPEELKLIGNELNEKLLAYGRNFQRNKDTQPSRIREQRSQDFLKSRPYNMPSATISRPMAPQPRPTEKKEKIKPLRGHGKAQVVAIGISTGGPNALRKIFPLLAPDFPVPILVVQHMPAGFTAEFARSLDKICPLEVKEAQEGDLLKPGRVLIAPGDHHITVEKKSLATIIHLDDRENVNGHKPSAGVLFESISENYQNNALAVIMTGMGKDGAKEIGEVYRQGGRTIAQDEESSIVFGMPRVAIEMGHIQQIIPLDEMAEAINRAAKE
ncbi:MAG: chemotaxis response regulator protein-glutamate methylesterase [Spirochaetaceae bacterium]|nr:chemotaxis response regulator protein-glutamate methylesterase [Spirochaetaceae bacterium]